MPDLASTEAPDVLATCQAHAAETAQALSRALGQPLEVAVGSPGAYQEAPDFAGPGLVLSIVVRGAAAVAIVPEASGVLPDWHGQPNADQQATLLALAKELGSLLLPEELAPIDFRAARVAHLAQALAAGQLRAEANLVPLELKTAAGAPARLSLIWPVMDPAGLFGEPAAETPASEESAAEEKPETKDAGAEEPGTETTDDEKADSPTAGAKVLRGVPTPSSPELPGYVRSLLRVKVPVIVTLASKKQPIARIVELGPGSIIHFNKSCEEMLQLHVNDETIAEGEAVKVGDKFGIRLTGLLLPGETFQPVRP